MRAPHPHTLMPWRLRALLAAGAVLSVLSVGVQADDAAFPAGAKPDAEGSGAGVYHRICQGCHMPAGQGAEGAGHYPALARNPNLAAWKYPALTILGGRHGMPPFGLPAQQAAEQRTAHLSDAEIADVVNYVRSSFGNAYTDVVTADQIAALPHPGN